MRVLSLALLCLVLPIFSFGQSDCDQPGALIYDDGDLENGIGTNSSFTFVHVAQLMEVASPGDRLTSFCFCFSKVPGGNAALDFDVAIWDDVNGAPGPLLATLDDVNGGSIATFPSNTWLRVNLTEPFEPGGNFFIGPTWGNEDIFLCNDESLATPLHPAFLDIDLLAGLTPPFAQLGVDLANDFRAAGIRSVMAGPATPGLDQASLVVPGFEFDTQDADGRTTFFSVANHRGSVQNVPVSYFGADVTGPAVATTNLDLGPNQTRAVNLRFAGVDSLAGGDGIARGLVLVGDGENGDISGDFHRVDFGSDFATGDRLVRPSDFCDSVRQRFLDFGSGTSFQILLNRPPSSGSSFSYTAYDEAGNQIATGTRSPRANLFTTTAVALVPGTSFGSIVFDLSNSEGGAVFAEYSAFGRFSLETSGECLDVGESSLLFTPHNGPTKSRIEPFDRGLFRSIR